MLSAGNLTEVVTLQKMVYSRNAVNEQILSFEKIADVRAAVKFQKGTAAVTFGESWNPTTIVVTLRYSKPFLNAARIIWEEKPYTVISNNGDRVNGSITLTCDLYNDGKDIEEKANG